MKLNIKLYFILYIYVLRLTGTLQFHRCSSKMKSAYYRGLILVEARRVQAGLVWTRCESIKEGSGLIINNMRRNKRRVLALLPHMASKYTFIIVATQEWITFVLGKEQCVYISEVHYIFRVCYSEIFFLNTWVEKWLFLSSILSLLSLNCRCTE